MPPVPVTDPYKLVGTRVADKYTIEAVIDRGGYGLVYRAFHEILGVPVALKFYTIIYEAVDDVKALMLGQLKPTFVEKHFHSSIETHAAAARDASTLILRTPTAASRRRRPRRQEIMPRDRCRSPTDQHQLARVDTSPAAPR